MNSSITSKLRSNLIPIFIHKKLGDLLPIWSMMAMFFLTSFIYNLLRPVKISLITNNLVGAEIIPFVKTWAVLPGAFFFAFIYTKLSNYLNRVQVYYAIMAIFLTFFAVFAISYPYSESLELTNIANFLEKLLPDGFKGFIAVIKYWNLTMFFVIAEVWGTMMLTVMAWGFANECININDAKKYYALIAVAADSAGIFSGQFARLLRNDYSWVATLQNTLIAIIAIGIVITIIYHYLNRTLGADSSNEAVQINNKEKISIINSCKAIIQSRYLLLITTIVISYNIAYNLFDVIWTDQLRRNIPDTGEFNAFMNQLTSITGLVAASVALIISGNVIRKFGWKIAALITPVIIIITSCGFFGSILSPNNLPATIIYGIFGNPMHNMIIFYGTMQYCLTRASKYTLFDSTKELAFVPLDKQQQRKGKIIIDSLISRISKSGGSLIFQGLLLILVDISATTPYVTVILLALVTIWILAISCLGLITKKTIDDSKQDSGNMQDAATVT